MRRNRLCLIGIVSIFILYKLVCYYHIIVPQRTLSNYLTKHASSRNGLHGFYFNNTEWGGEGKNFIQNLPLSFPGEFQKSNFSLRYKGILKVPESGRYTIYISSDDGAYLFINGGLVIDNGGIHPLTEAKKKLRLIKGLYLLELDYFQKEGGAGLSLSWKRHGEARRDIRDEDVFLLSETFSQERFNQLKARYKWSDVIELCFFAIFILSICFFIALRVDFSFFLRIPPFLDRSFSRRWYLWMAVLGIISVLSGRVELNLRLWPWFHLAHFFMLYLLSIFLYSVLRNGGRIPGFKTICIFSIFYIVAYTAYFIKSPWMKHNHDLHFFFTDIERFLKGDFTLMHYPLLAYSLIALCRRISLANFNFYIVIFSAVKFSFLLGFFYLLRGFLKNIGRPVFVFVFPFFFLLLPHMGNWFTARYDIIPAALLVCSLYLFWRKKYSWAYLVNSLGFMFKWVPIVVVPFMTFYLIYKKRYLEALKAVFVYILSVAIVIVIFSPSAFLSSFHFQGKRGIMGESFLNLFLTWFYGPQKASSCLDMPMQGIFTQDVLFGILAVALGIVFLIFVFNLRRAKDPVVTTLVYSSWAVVVFTFVNRVYSPQFIVWLLAVMYLLMIFKGRERLSPGYIMNCLFGIGLCSVSSWIFVDWHGQYHYVYKVFIFWVFFIVTFIKVILWKDEE